MENPRSEKVAVVDEVRERLEGAGAVLVTEYRGLNVAAMATLRRALADAGGDFKIYKNTLVRFAARDLGLELDSMLTGPTAIAFVRGDAVNVAKALRDFARTNPDLVVKGGILGGNVLDASRVRALAEIEPREVLLARLAGALGAPMQQFAGLLAALPRNLAYGIKALIEQGGAPGAPLDVPPPAPAEEAAPADAGAPVGDLDQPIDDGPAPEPEGDPAVDVGSPTPTAVEEATSGAEADTSPAADGTPAVDGTPAAADVEADAIPPKADDPAADIAPTVSSVPPDADDEPVAPINPADAAETEET